MRVSYLGLFKSVSLTFIFSLEESTVAATARRIVSTPCCRKQCLKSIPRDAAVSIAEGCLAELRGMKYVEKKIYLLEKVRSCVKTVHDSGYVSFNWKVGVAPAPSACNVCRKCFMAAYDCSHVTLMPSCEI